MNMKHMMLAVMMLLSSITASAQCGIENTAFKSGEYLSYDLYFNWKFVLLLMLNYMEKYIDYMQFFHYMQQPLVKMLVFTNYNQVISKYKERKTVLMFQVSKPILLAIL